ncbi:MAG: sigma-70 family RNA polymerase sigma factor [Gemmatimonadetes bacterium]|nr:sigma-70 family RNA polymerase sigma factor [Gemmatimonadota bacterium]
MADPAKSPDPTDEELVKLVRQGDRDASNELYRRYQQEVYDRALAKLGDRDAADSIRQQTFITVFEKIDQFRGESSLSAWIMKIGGRTTINYVKSPENQRRQRGETVPLRGASSEDSWDLILNRPGIQAPDQAGTPLEKVLSRERKLLVKQALGLLKPEDRRLIELFHIKQRSYEEIAAELGVPLRTVNTKLDRARKRLSAALKKLKNP